MMHLECAHITIPTIDTFSEIGQRSAAHTHIHTSNMYENRFCILPPHHALPLMRIINETLRNQSTLNILDIKNTSSAICALQKLCNVCAALCVIDVRCGEGRVYPASMRTGPKSACIAYVGWLRI